MTKLYHFQKIDNTSDLDLQLIITCPSYESIYSVKGCHFGLVKAVLLRENSLIIYILNDIYSYVITISKESIEYQNYFELFSKSHINNNKLSNLKARIDLEIIDNSANDEFDNIIFGDGNDYKINSILKKLDIQIFNSSVEITNEIKEFLFENYTYFIDMSLIYYNMDYSLNDRLQDYPFYELLFEISAMKNYDENSRPCYIESSKPFKLSEWKKKLKNKVLNVETWLSIQLKIKEDKEGKEDNKEKENPETEKPLTKNKNSDDEIYEPDIEQEEVTLESVGITYDEDSEVYSLYDGPEPIYKEEPNNYWIEVIKRERQIEKYAEERELVKQSYYFSDIFSEDNWKDGLASIIDNEVVYSLIMHMQHREEEEEEEEEKEFIEKTENEEGNEEDWEVSVDDF